MAIPVQKVGEGCILAKYIPTASAYLPNLRSLILTSVRIPKFFCPFIPIFVSVRILSDTV